MRLLLAVLILTAVATFVLTGTAARRIRVSPSLYRLDIAFHETGGREATTDQRYMLLLETGAAGKINTGWRLPYYGPKAEMHTIDLGTILECTPYDAEAAVRLDCSFESSAAAPAGRPEPRPKTRELPPVLHTRQARVDAVIPLDRPTPLASLDDPATRHRLEIMITARKM